MLHTILWFILILTLVSAVVGSLPRWPHSANWGYWPSSGLGTVLLVILILMLMGKL